MLSLTLPKQALSATVNEILDDTQDTRCRVVDIQPRICGIEFREEFKTLEPRILPSQALIRQRSAQRAQQPWTMQNQDIVTLVQAIGDWIEFPSSSLLILETTCGKQIAAELVGSVLQPIAEAVCWSLSAAACRDEDVTVASILSSLAWQLYKFGPVKAARFLDGKMNNTNEAQMAELMRLMLLQFRNRYIIVEADDIARVRKDTSQLDKLRSALQTLAEQVSSEDCRIKILLAGYGMSKPAESLTTGAPACSRRVISLRPPVPIPVCRQRHGTKPLFQNPGWLNLCSRARKQS